MKYLGLSFVLILSVIIFSCSEDSTGTELNLSSNQNCSSSHESQKLGEKHNYLLDVIKENYSICSSKPDQFISEFNRILIENAATISAEFGFNEEEFVEMVNSVEHDNNLLELLSNGNIDFKNYLNSYISDPVLQSVLLNFVELVEGFDNNLTFAEVESEICNLYSSFLS